MQRAFLLVCLAFLVSVLSGQDGAPVLTQYQESREVEDQSWAICQDKNRVMLFANRKGILAFDGQEWLSARIPVIPFSIQMNPRDEKIYVGAENDYGYIEKSENGTYWYVSLSGDSAGVGLVTKIAFNGNYVWFYGEKNISCFNTNSNNREFLLTSESGMPFTGLFITTENTFVNIKNKGLFRVDNDSLVSIPGGNRTREIDVLFSLPYSNELILIGLSNGKLNLFDGSNFFDYQINDNGYIADNILSEGLMIGDSLYAFSTLGGGAVVVDKLSGNVRYTINKQNGLPDDEIFAIGYDKSGGLWLSHQYGLTRADLNLPVTNFSFYPGLSGNLTTSITYNDELYVASNEGVFYLSEVRDYSEIEVLIRKDIAKSVAPTTGSAATTAADSDTDSIEPIVPTLQKSGAQDPPNTRKNIFNRIFGKRNATVPNDFEIVKEIPVLQNSTEVQQPETVAVIAPSGGQFSWQKVSRLKSVNHIYKKVSGFDEKCRQLVSTPYGILAATNRGLFLINSHKSTLLVRDRYINFINWEPFGNKYSVAANDGYFFISRQNSNWNVEEPDQDFTRPLYSIILTDNKTVWLGGENVAYRANLNEGNGTVNYVQYSVKNDFPQRYLLNLRNDSIFLFSETGVYFFDEIGDQFKPVNQDFIPASQEEIYSYPLSNIPLIKYGDEWIDPQKEFMEKDVSLLKLFDNILSINAEKDNIWIIEGDNNLFRINRKRSSSVTPDTDLFVKGIKNESGISFDLSNIVFNRGDNVIYFDIVAPTYLKKNLTEYQYYISKIMDDWSPWSAQTSYSKLIPKSGDYVLQIRAKDFWGQVGSPVSLGFTIKAPFTKTTLFYFLLVSVFLVLIFLFVRFREKQLQEENRVLEKKVSERTAKIAAQKEEITSSIEYASRIQMAMLPMIDLFQEAFTDYFIIFKPRDIVSGDFYWIGEDEENIFLTVADCTGHGVPGAFMSTLGISILNEITTHSHDLQANTILNLLREKIKTSLHQTGKEGEAADGMDISLCVIKKNKKSIQFSGAYNPLLIYTKGELREYKADRMPIGIHYGNEASFTNYGINVKLGDAFYIFSDGLNDQFGGPDGSKYKKSNFKALLSEICEKPMAEQKRLIENEFKKWKGIAEQVDDITIIGVRI